MPGPATVKPGFGLFKAALASLLLLLFDRQGYAQVKDTDKIEVVETSARKIGEVSLVRDQLVTVSGKIVDETGQPLPGTSIILQGTTIGTSADETGQFTFPEPVRAGQTLLFSYIGYETKEYTVKSNTSDQIEIEMTMDGIILMGKLAIDQPYAVETKSFWSRLKSIF